MKRDFKKSSKVQELAQEALSEFEKICTGSGYETARDIRNESASHYSFSAAKKNLDHTPSEMNCNLYLADQNGNEFFPLGEAVMFHGRLNRRWKTAVSKEQREELFLEWLNWNLNANSWLRKTHARFMSEFVFEALGRNKAVKKHYWVDPDLAGNWKDRLTPIYFQDMHK